LIFYTFDAEFLGQTDIKILNETTVLRLPSSTLPSPTFALLAQGQILTSF
jgi:hypothetical protein